jgi:hypothetical protein
MAAIIEIGALVTVESVKITGPLIGSLSGPAGAAFLLAAILGICALYAMGAFTLTDIKNLFEDIEIEAAA